MGASSDRDIPAPYHTSDRTSFAYVSARDRWPIILTSAIDDVHRATSALSIKESSGDAEAVAEAVAEGKRVVEELARLKYELQHDRALTPIPDDGFEDITTYNDELSRLGDKRSWFNAPWLYVECYLYRRMASIFALTQRWKHHDVFARQKLSTFRSSRPAVLELAARYNKLMSEIKSSDPSDKPAEERAAGEDAELLLFKEMCEICLWGNATDLSLLTSLTYDDIQKLQGSEARKNAESNILVNDLRDAFEVLRKARGTTYLGCRTVEIILDNAGFELFVDLVLAGYLLAAGLATCVVLHPKSIPWFVSDVIPADFGALLNTLANPKAFFEAHAPGDGPNEAGQAGPELTDAQLQDLSFLFQHWSDLHQDGKLIIRPNRFWTLSGSYWRLPAADANLLDDFRNSELVIFKGDLNYRKLTGDLMWDPTTPFSTAIGPLGNGSGIRTLALRTCKADVVVGLPPGEDERLRAAEGGGGDTGARKWAWTGKWAVVQFCNGKAP